MSNAKLPPGWSRKPLGKLAKIVSGGTPARNKPKFWENGTIPWATPTDITANHSRIITETKEYITEAGLRNSSAKLLPVGAVLMTSRATLGESKVAGVEMCTNQGFKSLVPTEQVDNWFLYYQMQLNKGRYARFGIGSTFLEVNKKDTEAFPIDVPPLPEQRKIARILSTVDEAIEHTEELIAKYQAIKQGLMHDLLTRGVDESGRLRPPRERAPELYKWTKLGWVPKEWEVVLTKDVFDMRLGKMLNKASKTGKESFPYLANRNVQWDYVDLSELDTMDFTFEERKKYRLKPDDLLICEGGEVGRTALWRGEMKNCFFQKAIHRLRTKDGKVLPRFMLRYMRFAHDTGRLTYFTSQTSIAHLTGEKLAILPAPAPKQNEQEQIIQVFDSIDDQIMFERQQLEKLVTIKAGLMQDLLTGHVRVKL